MDLQSELFEGMILSGTRWRDLLSLAGQERPGDPLTLEDVASAVRLVVPFAATGCPVEIDLQPQPPTQSKKVP